MTALQYSSDGNYTQIWKGSKNWCWNTPVSTLAKNLEPGQVAHLVVSLNLDRGNFKEYTEVTLWNKARSMRFHRQSEDGDSPQKLYG